MIETRITKKAKERATSITFCSSDDNREIRNDKPARTKQNAVNGEIAPSGVPAINPSILKPRCSIARCIPKEERKNKRREINVQIMLIIIPTLLSQLLLENRVHSKTAIPKNMNKIAVLGAIGIKSELKLANTGIFKSQPSRAIIPIPAVNRPKRRANRAGLPVSSLSFTSSALVLSSSFIIVGYLFQLNVKQSEQLKQLICCVGL